MPDKATSSQKRAKVQKRASSVKDWALNQIRKAGKPPSPKRYKPKRIR